MMWDDPRPRDSFIWMLVGMVLLGGLVWIGESQGAVDDSGAMVLMAGMGMLGSWAVVMGLGNFLAWAAMVSAEASRRRREIEVMTPTNQALLLASRLTPEQVSVLPELRYRYEVESVVGSLGTAHFLRTQGGSVPFPWIEEFLRDCGQVSLRPVRTYGDGTPGRAYAVAFTEWLVQQGYVSPALGSRAATWLTEQSKSQVMKVLGFENYD